MFTITYKDWQKKIVEHTETVVDDDGEHEQSCPNGIVKEKGKPDIVWCEYNGRRYEWILQVE